MRSFIEEVLEKNWSDLHEETIEAGKKVLLDTVGAMIAGVNEKSTQTLMKQLVKESEGSYAVVGSDASFTREAAGFIHGVASVAIELDEGNQWSKGHPAAHVVPAMLTDAQRKEQYRGRDLLLQLVKAYELCSRFGRATTLVPDAHAHGTWGVMGATATVLLLEDCTVDEFIDGLNISATFAMPTMWNAAIEGALVRNVYVGNAMQNALKTSDLLKAGFLAPKGNIEYVYGNVIGTAYDKESFSESITEWDIERNYFKDHAFCRYVHAPLDAFQQLVQENDMDIKQIKRVNVWTYSRAATLHRSDYHNALSAKFSIPYALSVWAHTEKSDHSIFAEEFLQRDDIRGMANMVDVAVSKELEKGHPNVMAAEVEVELESVAIFKKRLDLADSGLGKDVTLVHLAEKFNPLTTTFPTEKQ